MRPTPEEIAAFADGEALGARAVAIAAAIASDPALTAQVEAHRALKAQLAAHFAPILDERVPARLSEPLAPAGEVIDFAAAKQLQVQRRTLPRWTWLAAPALAASLVLALVIPRGDKASSDYAPAQLAAALDNQLVATQTADAHTRVLLSFRDDAGAYCRAFANSAQSGIACRDGKGWRLRSLGVGATADAGEFRQAGSDGAAVLAAAQEMASGPALDAAEEAAAKRIGWR